MGFLFKLNNLIVIARFNEDLKWLDNLDCDVVIYNKGEDIDPKYNAIKIENYGREAETYLRAICEFHEKIEHYYDHVTFLQANPFDHNNEILKFLPQNNNEIKYSHPYFLTQNNYRWISLYYKQFGADKNEIDTKFTYETYDWVKTSSISDIYVNVLKNTMLNLGLPWYDSYICFPHAQFVIPKKYICAKPISWWKNAYKVFEESENAYKNLNYPGMPYVFEQLWYTIFTHY